MLSEVFQTQIWLNFHEGKPQTNGKKYAYTLEYIERPGEMPWKIIRTNKDGSCSWEEFQTLAEFLQYTPADSCIKTLCAK